ncbi:hypothetical protein HD806DRAFT_517920 [Xylariaceae sp. AK1471]|nr:hypothetical protein HD806DRAFT_517920 [Xylariaceae sp. AK1471]
MTSLFPSHSHFLVGKLSSSITTSIPYTFVYLLVTSRSGITTFTALPPETSRLQIPAQGLSQYSPTNMAATHYHLFKDGSFSFGGISKTDVTPYAPWNELLNRQTQGVWVTYGPNRSASDAARGWGIFIQTKANQIIQIHPFEKTLGKNIVVAVQQSATRHRSSAAKSDYEEMISTATYISGRATVPDTTVGDILNTTQRSGIAYYRLKEGRGHALIGLRFWIYIALEQIAVHLKKLQESIGRIALQKMRAETIYAGDRVIKGIALAHKWDGESLDVLAECNAYNKALELRFDTFGF